MKTLAASVIALSAVACSGAETPVPDHSTSASDATASAPSSTAEAPAASATVTGSTAPPNGPDKSFATRLAGKAEAAVEALAVSDQEILAAGFYRSKASGDAAPLATQEGFGDPFVARIGFDGAVLAQKALEGISAHGAARATDGQWLVAVEYSGPPPKGSTLPESTRGHVAVMKLDRASLEPLWASGPMTKGLEELPRVAARPDGGAYVALSFFAQGLKDPLEPVSKGCSDVLVASFDKSGKLAWRKRIEPSTDACDRPLGVAVAKNGDVLVAGYAGAPKGYYAADGVRSSAFVTRLTSEGELVWTKQVGSAGVHMAGDVAVGPDGSIVVGGVLSGEVDLFGKKAKATGRHDLFVAALGDDGSAKWTRTFAGSTDKVVDKEMKARHFIMVQGNELQYLARHGNAFALSSVDVANDGSIAIGGWFMADLTIGATRLEHKDGQDAYAAAFVAKLGPDGSPIWADKLVVAEYGSCGYDVKLAKGSVITGTQGGFVVARTSGAQSP